ncbi:MAG: hypothetical protein LBV19_09260 [Streptococcaceae bacterium]|jgi:hypothetical protein|nr:hypothetical protein [Streptococcaceae bacterium]
MWILHWIGSPQVELVNNGSDSLQIEKIYRKRYGLTKLDWLNFLKTDLTPEKKAELIEIKDRVKLQGRPYHPELDEAYWKSRGY